MRELNERTAPCLLQGKVYANNQNLMKVSYLEINYSRLRSRSEHRHASDDYM